MEEKERLSRLENEVDRLVAPAWRRRTAGEHRWPSAVCILALIGLQLALPERLSLGPRPLLPLIEVALIGVLLTANPGRMTPGRGWLRHLGLLLIAVASLGTAWSVVRLIGEIVGGHGADTAAELLAGGGAVWVSNVLIFAVWYWEGDRGGPMRRAVGERQTPDLLFPQMSMPQAHPDWEPRFLDYLYLAFTNSTAFSPTDTMPLARWAKAVMMLQATLSLLIAALVVAKAVNTLQ